MKAKHIKVLKSLALTGREWGREEGRKKEKSNDLKVSYVLTFFLLEYEESIRC